MTPSIIELAELRQRAEERVAQADSAAKLDMHPLRMLHELQVHEIELKLQNEALIATNRDLEVLRKHYETLFEHAPVGYFTLSLDGAVLSANQRGFEMLKTNSDALLGTELRDYFQPDSVKVLDALIASAMHDGDDVFADNLLVQCPQSLPLYVKAQCRKIDFGELQDQAVLLAMMDVSALKFAMDDVMSRLRV